MKKQQYVIVRTYSAGVHAGTLVSQVGKEVVLKDARRLWYWKGAASLSQIAVQGVSNPNESKFSIEVPLIKLTEAIETIATTPLGEKNIKAVPVWLC